MRGRFGGPSFFAEEASVTSRVLVILRPDGSTRFDLVVIPDRFRGRMDDIRRCIGGLSRVESVQFSPAQSRFSITVKAGGAEPRRIIGEVCAMGCIVRLVRVPFTIAA